VAIEFRWAHSQDSLLPRLAADLAGRRVDAALGCDDLAVDMRGRRVLRCYDSRRTDPPRASISFAAFLSKETKVFAPSQPPS
jgi:hypothetical protein